MLGAVDLSPVGVILGVFGVAGTLTTVLVFVIGSRSKTLAQIQDQTINALDARVSELSEALESEIRRNGQNRALLGERDRRIEALAAQVHTLQDVVTSREAIENLSKQLNARHDQLLEAVTGRRAR
jgi:G:T/U-mismatch repair DNA glycosylase